MEVTLYSVTIRYPVSKSLSLQEEIGSPKHWIKFFTTLRDLAATSDRRREFEECLSLVKWSNTCSAREVKVVGMPTYILFTFGFGCLDFLEDFDRSLYTNVFK